MKRYYWHLDLTEVQKKALVTGLLHRFKFLIDVRWFGVNSLVIQFAEMGRNLYPDESCAAYPHRLGKAVSVDSIHTEQVSCYVNGFLMAAQY